MESLQVGQWEMRRQWRCAGRARRKFRVLAEEVETHLCERKFGELLLHQRARRCTSRCWNSRRAGAAASRAGAAARSIANLVRARSLGARIALLARRAVDNRMRVQKTTAPRTPRAPERSRHQPTAASAYGAVVGASARLDLQRIAPRGSADLQPVQVRPCRSAAAQGSVGRPLTPRLARGSAELATVDDARPPALFAPPRRARRRRRAASRRRGAAETCRAARRPSSSAGSAPRRSSARRRRLGCAPRGAVRREPQPPPPHGGALRLPRVLPSRSAAAAARRVASSLALVRLRRAEGRRRLRREHANRRVGGAFRRVRRRDGAERPASPRWSLEGRRARRRRRAAAAALPRSARLLPVAGGDPRGAQRPPPHRASPRHVRTARRSAGARTRGSRRRRTRTRRRRRAARVEWLLAQHLEVAQVGSMLATTPAPSRAPSSSASQTWRNWWWRRERRCSARARSSRRRRR